MIVHTVKFDHPMTNAGLVIDEARRGTLNAIPSPGAHGDPCSIADLAPVLDAVISPPPVLEVAQETNRLLEKIQAGIHNLQLQSDPLIQQFQTLAVRLATRIVKKMIGSSDAIQSERLVHLLDEVMQRPELPVRAYLHPDVVADVSEMMTRKSTADFPLEIRSDQSLARGECRIEYDSHELISSVETQLAEIENRLMEAITNVDA